MFDFEIHSVNSADVNAKDSSTEGAGVRAVSTSDKTATPIARLILAHGAGAGKHHDFMQAMASQLTSQNIEVVLFNFPYMQTMMETGKRRPPDKAEKLLAHFNALINEVANTQASVPTFIGGKSMGGRMATMLLDDAESIIGAIAFGYPFHPPGKPEKLRTAHLETLSKPLLILQGERDTFGTKDEVSAYSLSSAIAVSYLADGDHSFKPRKQSGFTLETHIECAAKSTADFIKARVNT
ncbi:alpha/beta family hydrolase [Alteromonas sp. CI.11.F.A3]|uniref:alpha/beta family hydrolase n=1 Tax=Alteromonas sp. CI.11.F.A3 TaxID=3079555 RepID=UPI002941CA52|nr:alpha/beta family hydrolase [Alteromonas sp. CI.11.F.A3]WOI36195.1 alpha/beta family hydrolase [Alteromonas sp. CI.11.F.A3]